MRPQKFILAFLLCSWLSHAEVQATQLPLYLAFQAEEKSPLNFSVLIIRHRNYNLSLAVKFRNTEERALARAVIGDVVTLCEKRSDCGEKSSFKITIRAGERLIFSGIKSGVGYYAHGESFFWRKILDIPLRPGIYHFSVEEPDLGTGFSKVDAEWIFNTDARQSDLSD